MLGHQSDWPMQNNPEDIKWRLEKNKVYHKEYDPGFDNKKMRLIYRKALNADVPIHVEKDYYDKRFMVKPP